MVSNIHTSEFMQETRKNKSYSASRQHRVGKGDSREDSVTNHASTRVFIPISSVNTVNRVTGDRPGGREELKPSHFRILVLFITRK
jgi:hypothetical protein